MATTDAKPGFRLPWSPDRTESEARAETTDDAPVGEALRTDQEIETPDMIDAAPAATDHTAAVDEGTAGPDTTFEGQAPEDAPVDSPAAAEMESTDSDAAASGRKPNKFMADLTRAMHGAAETAKADTLARFTADAKAHIESIHAATAVEAGELRKQADDDVASIREWSKAEIARIREETDERITHRKSRLEREIEAHAADIEGRIERVQHRIDAFEGEMAQFFERLLAEEDATRFAAMAESLPEPPPFDDDAGVAIQAADARDAQVDELPAERAVIVEPWPEIPTEAVAEPVEATEDVESVETAEADPAEATAENATAETPTEEQPAPETIEPEAEATEVDPRIGALGLTPDFEAAEAEAAAFTPEDAQPEEEIAVIADDALAARLAGLVPDVETDGAESTTTRVVVTGLVSVASIAGFKRQLSRVAGVHSVGVSSGPDGEFLFAVAHESALVLRDAITTLPGFGARVTNETNGELTVTARDPESEG
jgi:hypothetical protein